MNWSLLVYLGKVSAELVDQYWPSAVVFEVLEPALSLVVQLVNHRPGVFVDHVQLGLLSLEETNPLIQELTSSRKKQLPKSDCCIDVDNFVARFS